MHPRSYITFASLVVCAFSAHAEYNAPDLNNRAPAEPRYGIAAMVGRSAPTLAMSLQKAVETTPSAARRIAVEAAKPAEVTGFKPVGNRAFVDTHASAAKQRETAIESLQTQKVLEGELSRVRAMLAQSELEGAPIAPEPAPVAPAPAPAAADENTFVDNGSPAGRLLGSLQGDTSARAEMAGRLRMARESLTKKDPRFSKLSNASGGVGFQATLEFNHSIRGSSAAAAPSRYGYRRRWGTGDGGVGESRGRKLGFVVPTDGEAKKPLFAVDGPGSTLVAHKPRYSDSAIQENGKGGPGAGAGAGGAGARGDRHRPSYGDKTIASAYDGGGAGAAP